MRIGKVGWENKEREKEKKEGLARLLKRWLLVLLVVSNMVFLVVSLGWVFN